MMPAVRLALLVVLLWTLPAFAQSPAWVAPLRNGGYVIVLRHGATFADQADTNPLDPKDTAHQRQLNDSGRSAATAIGDALRKLKIPVAQVQTSLFQRAVDTGTLLGFGAVTPTVDLTEGGLVVTPNENDRRAKALRKLAGTAPPAGSNVILVTHKPNLMDAFGKDWFDVREGEASIFKADGQGGFSLVGRVPAADWPRFAQSR